MSPESSVSCHGLFENGSAGQHFFCFSAKGMGAIEMSGRLGPVRFGVEHCGSLPDTTGQLFPIFLIERQAMKHPTNLIPVLLLALLVAACASEQKKSAETAPASGVQSGEMSAVSDKGDAATAVQLSSITAKVVGVDQATRTITLEGPDGKTLDVEASDKVRNLDQIKVGDKVTVDYYEGLLAQINAPGAPTQDVTMMDAAMRAPKGERPGGGVASSVTATVTIEFVDNFRHVVQFKGPLGHSTVLQVKRPEFREMLKNLKAGDTVNLTYFEALAVDVRPAGN
jgi:hypothetical protein